MKVNHILKRWQGRQEMILHKPINPDSFVADFAKDEDDFP
jgi:hypothetical protein